MTKAEIVKEVAGVLHIPASDAKDAIEVTFLAIQKALERGEKVLIQGLGVFQVVERKAKVGRNPRTGEKVEIPARKRVKFKQSKEFVLK